MRIVPLTFRKATAFVAQHHRHNRPPQGSKFCIGVEGDGGGLVGVVIVGRPISRHFDNGFTAEVTRTCTDGTKNANSALYGAAWRAAKAMGYTRIVTYTQAGESGVSLKAAGWRKVKDLAARKNWAESSVKLRKLRRADEPAGIERALWEVVIENA